MLASLELVRAPFAIGWLAVLLVWETAAPFFDYFRQRGRDRARHGGRNLTIGLLNNVLISLAFVALWALAAGWSEARRFGLLHRPEWPGWAHALCAVLILDLWTYGWHRLNHQLPFLWRFHRMHHSDPHMDVTTGSRFHAGEIALSSILRLPILALAGIQLGELVLYETAMFAVVQFHHANIGLPERLDRALRLLLVTPAMHKVHHSRCRPETDSNYSAFLSAWDRLFGTLRIHPRPHAIRFGLEGLDHARHQSLRGLLVTPFARRTPGPSDTDISTTSRPA
jgi:sterol desaturase/sphingolipid hydroxylase (fatty acid hydroxylase superfamily)